MQSYLALNPHLLLLLYQIGFQGKDPSTDFRSQVRFFLLFSFFFAGMEKRSVL